MANTENYGLYKPDKADAIDVHDTLANNFILIDTALKETEDKSVSNEKKVVNVLGLKEFEHLKVAVTGGFDWAPVFNKAFTDAKLISGIVVMPFGSFDVYSTLSIPEYVNLIGAGESPNGSVINYKGSGGWAIKTSGTHERVKISGIRLELNGNGNGIMIGEYGANLPAGKVPTNFELASISVSGIGASYTGVMTINASHYNFRNVRIGYGTTAGKGLSIYADAYNSGVATFIDCTLGRVDANSTGVEIDGTVNLDDFTFIGCYYGGKNPINIGSDGTFVRNVNFYGGHIEGRNVGQTVHLMSLHNVLGGTAFGITFAAFQEEFTHCVAFKGEVSKFNILGGEVNGVWNTIFKDNGASLIEDCMLQPGRVTNNVKKDGAGNIIATLDPLTFSAGFSDKNFKFDTRRLAVENIRAKYVFSIDGANKRYFASAPTATLAHTRGDTVENTLPSRVKNITHWRCEVSGTPGEFLAYGTGWGTKSERNALTLTANDKGYQFKLTDDALTTNIWNGTAWI